MHANFVVVKLSLSKHSLMMSFSGMKLIKCTNLINLWIILNILVTIAVLGVEKYGQDYRI